jgi:hypothetical protein
MIKTTQWVVEVDGKQFELVRGGWSHAQHIVPSPQWPALTAALLDATPLLTLSNRLLFQLGGRLLDMGDARSALGPLELAWSRDKSPRHAARLGRALRSAGNPGRALGVCCLQRNDSICITVAAAAHCDLGPKMKFAAVKLARRALAMSPPGSKREARRVLERARAL